MAKLDSPWLRRGLTCLLTILFLTAAAGTLCASEADLAIPDLHQGTFKSLGGMSAWNVLAIGALVICGTLGISLYQYFQIKKQPAHKSMLDVAEIIYQTCQAYLIQQGKFLLMLFALIAFAIGYYLLGGTSEPEAGAVSEAAATASAHPAGPPMSKPVTLALVLLFAVVGMAGSYSVAWYGIRVNTLAYRFEERGVWRGG